MKSIFSFISLLILFISCKKEKQNLWNQGIKTEVKDISNNSFREKILPRIEHENDRKKLTILLDRLDKQNLSLCDFIRREFEIDDSCFAIAKETYPDPEMQIKFMEVHDNVYEIAHRKFLKQTNFTEHDALFLTVVYSFDDNVKKFCGKY
ncbi:hypothetical protein [Chryseobacterium sp. JUb7]|uniref:hypothetical protein n=1 Tax=Chryseobacterium sp. JUb7 TaxID=2940599 RepID=UPI0021696E71|nr:hypothetical protein [Chryseobacterium sp. JUb7]MCS3529500.1 hypothetical protein [Chryseobacterium sp. JUb7]